MYKKRFISLKTKIVASTFVPIIISYFIVVPIILAILFNSLDSSAKAEFERLAEKYSASFESKISSAMNYLTIIANALQYRSAGGVTDRAAMQREVMNIFDSYGIIDGSSVYFEPNMFDGKDAEYKGSDYGTETSGRIAFYFYRDAGKTKFLPEALSEDEEFTMTHYTLARAQNKPIYTSPVIHEVAGHEIPMFTLTYPVKDSRDNFIGAVTVDVFLEDLYNQIQNENIYETGYVIISNDRNQVIYSPDFDHVGKQRHEVGIFFDLPKNGESHIYLNSKSILNGKRTMLIIESIYIPQLDSYFYITVSAPLAEINASGIRIMTGVILFTITVIMIIALLERYLTKRITAPVKEITEKIGIISNGGYDARILGDYRDEFGVIKDSVNIMAESIETYIKEAKNSLDVLRNIMDGLESFIYVTVPETGELLFINKMMREHFGIEGAGIGEKCYELLQEGGGSECAGCPCRELDEDGEKVVVWEEHNKKTDRHYRKTDRYIDWIGGVKVHLQHSVDITDIKRYMDDKIEAEREAIALRSEKEKAEAAAKSKNDFLARMSHEIRTPMNAVMGMSELILRKELPQDVYENALAIKSASTNLLAIINDILDFSKIESGMMEIVEGAYQLSSLINDVTGIIKIRMIEKPVHFAVYVDPMVPNSLIGDEIRIRQILINVLSNAVKYTAEGSITLKVTGRSTSRSKRETGPEMACGYEPESGAAVLTFEVSDTGYGIREEDMKKLFGEFSRLDSDKNRAIEGTGLGLAITHKLCKIMGGDIGVSSEYGKGSVFTIELPQRYKEYKPFAQIEDVTNISVLLYETRVVYQECVAAALSGLGVRYKIASSIHELYEDMPEYTYVFISSYVYGSIKPAVSELETPPKIVLLADITETAAPREARVLALPAHVLSVANILVGGTDVSGETYTAGASFTAPEAKILIADDITANLSVAAGLMAPYEMQISTCVNGLEAVRMVQEDEYDLIFMDHMMPVMDGIEATGKIRELDGQYYQEVPIIALTANAVSGVREMFIQNGMNDFLAKPIELVKLDAILDKWIPKNKRGKAVQQEEESEVTAELIDAIRKVEQIDLDRALTVLGGSIGAYERVVKLSIRLFPENIERLNTFIESDIAAYAIEVHGFKGVLQNIGAYGMGELAYELEKLSKAGKWEKCIERHPAFMESVNEFYSIMSVIVKQSDGKPKEAGNKADLEAVIPELEESADYYNSVRALAALSPIEAYSYGERIDRAVTELRDAFENFDFDTALEIIEYLKGEVS